MPEARAPMSLSSKSAPADDWRREAWAVFVKDARSEWRTRSAVSTILMFALVTIFLVGMLVKTEGFGMTQRLVQDVAGAIARNERILETHNSELRAQILAALYWVILYFSAMTGLSRVFVKEEEMRTAPALRLAARPSAVLGGKLLFNLLLLELVTVVVLPPFLLFFRPEVKSWPLLLALLTTGAAALAGSATLLGAIVARAGNRGYLMLILGFGPLLPILIFGINGTADALYSGTGNNLVPLVSYLILMTALSALLFERVWAD